MKKLNRKGFTLIELLAVIVILAVVMVVTIPSVLNSMDSAKQNQLKNAASSVAEWFQKNYDIATLSSGIASPDAAYTTFATTATITAMTGTNGFTICDESAATPTSCNNAVLTAAGLSDPTNNVSKVNVKVNGSNKVCVELTAKNGGKFYTDASHVTATGGSGC